MNNSDMGLLRRFFKYVKPYKKPLRNVYLLYFLNSLLNLVPAASLRYYFDLVVDPKPVSVFGINLDSTSFINTTADRVWYSAAYFAGVLCLIVLANSVGVIMWRFSTKVTQRLLLDIKVHVNHHLHKLSFSYFEQERTGEIMSRTVNDVMNMEQMLKSSYDMAYAMTMLVTAPLIMIGMSPLFFLFTLLPLPVLYLAVRQIRLRLRPLYRQMREQQADITASMQEHISGIREIKAFGREKSAQRDYSRSNLAYIRSVNDAMKIFSVNHQVLYGMRDVSMILVGTAGGIMIATGTGGVTLGMITAFLPLMSFFFDPFMRFTGLYDVIQRGLASAERIFEFLDNEPDIKDGPKAKWFDIKEGSIEFDNVTFGYEKDMPILRELSLKVEPGKTVAIVGPTGAGKSSLVSLIPRFYEVDSGRILIDGRPLPEIKMDAIRAAIGIVFQETFLFHGTIAENIAYSRPQASNDEIREAARLANAAEFIEKLPEGYDTKIGERGVKLSGGQRQRLAIARMILKNPPILILDEATSAVDTETEKLIQDGLDHLMEGRTAFVIAHRLSTIRKADLILVLEAGQVSEQGTHEELMKKGGKYAELTRASGF